MPVIFAVAVSVPPGPINDSVNPDVEDVCVFIFVSETEFDVDPDDEGDELGAVFDPPAKVLSCANPTEGPGEKRKIEYTFF